MQITNSNSFIYKKIPLSGNFLKDIRSQLIVLFGILLLVEIIFWTSTYPTQNNYYNQYNHTIGYIENVILGFFAPELCTLYILNLLIRQYLKLFKFQFVSINKSSIIRYQLSFIPLFAVAFFLFFPFTLHVRYILREFPNYSAERYVYYLQNSITLDMYLMYLPFVFLLGYILVNISLAKDFFNLSSSNPSVDVIKEHTISKVPLPNIVEETIAPHNDSSHLLAIEGRNSNGINLLKTEDAYFFETEDEHYYIIHPSGRYRIAQSLNTLETVLNPTLFFRINRKYIINLNYLKTYNYWEKGKYIITLSTPTETTLTMPRARYHDLKTAVHLHIFG